MTAATKSAALDSLDDVLVLHSMANRQDSSQPTLPPPYQQNTRPHTTQPGFSPGRMDYGGQRQLHNHNNRLRKVGSNSSNSAGRMMPPPPTRGAATAAFGIRDFESGQPGPSIQSHTQLISPSNPNPDFFNHTGHNSLSTPSHYRPQLGNMPPAGNAERNTGIYLSSAGRLSTGRLPQQTPPSSQRQPLAREGDSSINRSHMSGYGINAGMRVGGQPQGTKPSYAFHPFIESPAHNTSMLRAFYLPEKQSRTVQTRRLIKAKSVPELSTLCTLWPKPLNIHTSLATAFTDLKSHTPLQRHLHIVNSVS